MASEIARGAGRVRWVFGALAFAALTAGSAAAQHPERANVAADSLRRIQSVIPRSGPPGTLISIYSENMPLQARIVVGVGAIGFGFEEIGVARQQEFGEVSARVRLPESVGWERPVYLILFNGVFSPIGISDAFHVTDMRGMVRRQGTLASQAVGCMTLRDGDDLVYGLTGRLEGLQAGSEVVVEGRYYESESCGTPNTLEVVRARRAGT